MPRTKNPKTLSRWYKSRCPDLPGVYQVEDNVKSSRLTLVWFAYWDGRIFHCRALSPNTAYNNRRLKSGYGPWPVRWRGLKHKPATHPAPSKEYVHDDDFALAT